MKLLAISDLHGHLPKVTPVWGADVAVIAGDVVPASTTFHGTTQEGLIKQVTWAHDVFIPWLASIPVAEVVLVWGNHDWLADQKGGSLIPDAWWPDHVHVLTNRGVSLDGVHFYGVPQTPRFFDWAFNEDDDADTLGRRWDAVDPQTDVLVTHGPPSGVCDWVGHRQGQRVGSRTQAQWLRGDGPRPKLSFCGHVHSAGGSSGKIGSTAIHNVAAVNERYIYTRGPKMVSL